ncbi:MAG TPA: alpha/beta hydrolase [Symbiobacteriaceae bacterium]|nr:alpha/beta hydrolase [Symbiobacteriaceae bacterium]
MPYAKHLYYEEAGAGRPVILIHCPALSHVYWRPVMERLKGVCRCVAIDLRGHGKSGLGDTPWTFRDAAADLHMLTETLHLERPVLVGYSSGGTIALQAAIERPDLYGGLVPISSFSECCTWTLKAKVGMGILGVDLGLTRMIGPNIIGTNSVDKAHTQAMLPDAKGVNPVSLRCYMAETVRVNFTADLNRVQIPVLLVYGTDDDWMHVYYRILQERLPHARSIFFPRCDHRVPTRFPDSFADAVAEFVAGLEPDGREEPVFLLPSLDHPGVEEHQLHM